MAIRWQAIKYSSKGAYIKHQGLRYYISEFMSVDDNKAVLPLNNFGGLVLEVNESGDKARVYGSYN